MIRQFSQRLQARRLHVSAPALQWWVSEAKKPVGGSLRVEEQPELPKNAPAALAGIVQECTDQIGLQNIAIIDRRQQPASTGAPPPSIDVVGSVQSERHLVEAQAMLRSFVKQRHQTLPHTDGLVTPRRMLLVRRRNERHQRHTAVPNRVGSWVAVDTNVDGIRVHLMTPERRQEIKLEDLANEDLVNEEEDLGALSTEYVDARTIIESDPGDFGFSDKLREMSLAAIKSTNPQDLKNVLKQAEEQQISGYPLSEEDVEVVAAAICYHGHSKFLNEVRTEERMREWRDLCNLKADLLLDFFEFGIEASNRTLLRNQRLLTLLYRTFTSPAKPKETGELDAYFDIARLTPVRGILENSRAIQDIEVVGMVLASLAHAGQMSPFWRTVEAAHLRTSNSDNVASLVEVCMRLVVSTGSKDDITYALQTYMPEKFLAHGLKFTPTLSQLALSALKIVDPEGIRYEPLRAMLQNSPACMG